MNLSIKYSNREIINIKKIIDCLGQRSNERFVKIVIIIIAFLSSAILFLLLRQVGGIYNEGSTNRTIGSFISLIPVAMIMSFYTYYAKTKNQKLINFYASISLIKFNDRELMLDNIGISYDDVSIIAVYTDKVFNCDYYIVISNDLKLLIFKQVENVGNMIKKIGIDVATFDRIESMQNYIEKK